MISVQLKGEIPELKKDYVTYRSFKNFDHEKFLQELSEQLDVITEHSNVETAYHNFETTFIKVVDKNIPLKKRKYMHHLRIKVCDRKFTKSVRYTINF